MVIKFKSSVHWFKDVLKLIPFLNNFVTCGVTVLMIRKSSLFCLVFGSLLLRSVCLFSIFICRFSFSEEFGTQGDDDDEFDKPTDLAINDGKLYVVDSRK